MTKNLIDKLYSKQKLSHEELIFLIENSTKKDCAYLSSLARDRRIQNYGHDVYVRGLIEFTNFCRCDCLYCGIRRSNKDAQRYRLTSTQILECAKLGYSLGFRTFVLQGGEDSYYTGARLANIVYEIKQKYPDCAVTLSAGEHPRETYELWKNAGADRYLLRHETANAEHYQKLHPKSQSYDMRLRCLYTLKELGFQTGCGFMVGSPYQTIENLADDLEFIRSFEPEMVGIGPFIAHHSTPFCNMPNGSAELTLMMLSIVRLMLPKVLLPSTTALGTIKDNGREAGILAGANVVMPNLSPTDVREKYLLYDNKICTGDEAAESLESLKRKIERIGYRIVVDRGDYKR